MHRLTDTARHEELTNLNRDGWDALHVLEDASASAHATHHLQHGITPAIVADGDGLLTCPNSTDVWESARWMVCDDTKKRIKSPGVSAPLHMYFNVSTRSAPEPSKRTDP